VKPKCEGRSTKYEVSVLKFEMAKASGFGFVNVKFFALRLLTSCFYVILRTSTFALPVPHLPLRASVSLCFAFLLLYLNAMGRIAKPATLPLILLVAAT